ncbi:nuclease [Clostridium botulinum]|uniref:Nuclease n=2 Tax=Clostridium botulinum TaxID=1491 RepID=A0A846I700_CLOBO|nr:hypothetical protein CLJ_B1722 [Clostridium botulinum Ba4 str. 657]AUN03178.1 nuclease [Clostridium botulinum]EDT86234.1 endo/excinuclease domain protein [Clostridium botulinum Bf]AXG91169.1 nuclease [Clostridium botulinum]MBN3376509.1 nuclease [Clostridium botulinum]
MKYELRYEIYYRLCKSLHKKAKKLLKSVNIHIVEDIFR